MSYGFVIDQRKCIGCHACTVACKAENDVPLGSFRTWVKYVEKGAYPEVRRHFSVLRCNHCDAAPCVTICPVNALGKREDGIVDLDRDTCIGCRACMQACPYDALYLNEHTGTAEKCHFCAHRTELGLEPACVVVCPEQAIIAGDVDDPGAKIAKIIANEPTEQRKVDKGTKPKVWYVDALPEALVPGASREQPMWLWSDRARAPFHVPAGMEAPADLVTSLNASPKVAWGWHIWAYLFTKNVAAGVMLLAPLLGLLGLHRPDHLAAALLPEAIALLFLGLTGGLLIHDLGRPERFWRILFAPNPKSWLVKGTWVISAFGLLTTASAMARLFGQHDAADLLRIVNAPLALMASGYTAFLFHQCRGRDLWLGQDLFAHLIAQALLCGVIALAILAGPEHQSFWILGAGLSVLNALWLLVWHEKGRLNADGKKAEAIIHERGDDKRAAAWLGGAALTAVLGAVGVPLMALALLVTATVGLLLWERAWIRAGQEVPNS